MESLEKAAKLTPADVRAQWFQATLLCQTLQPDKGGEGFLAIENSHAWDKLPGAFWDDYLECATVTSMPAHALRAADHLKALNAPESQMRDFLAGGAAKRFDEVDLTKDYDPKEVWTVHRNGNDLDLTSTACTIRFRVHDNWEVEKLGLSKGSCVAGFITGHYKGKKYTNPSVMLLVQRPKDGETLQDYANKFMMKGDSLTPFSPTKCPAEKCLAYEAVQAGMYQEDGGGRGRLVIFERDEPQFPGLMFESPTGPPQPNEKDKGQYYRPSQVQRRIPGKLYYVVLLDTSASVEQPALADFDFFLKNLTVE
jgi:hypothetical protein